MRGEEAKVTEQGEAGAGDRGAPCAPFFQDPEEHGGGLGERDHTIPQYLCGQPGDALLPLAAVAVLAAARPCSAPHAPQHDEETLSAVSAARRLPRATLAPSPQDQRHARHLCSQELPRGLMVRGGMVLGRA